MASSIEKSVTHQLNLRFFDLDIDIRSDSVVYLDELARLYHRFRGRGNASPAGPVQPAVEFVVLTKPDNTWGRPVLIQDGQVWPLADARMLAAYSPHIMFNTIAAKVQSHYLIHAGAMAYGNQGLILAADSLHGKTTLVLELARRGFKFLSDEAAALGRADKKLHPFPRSLRVRPGSLKLGGFFEVTSEVPLWQGKYLLDIEQIQPDSLGQAAPIRHVIILQDPAKTETESPDQELAVLVEHLDQAFLADVRQIEGVAEVRLETEYNYPLLKLRSTHCSFVFSQLEALCQAHQVLILDARTGLIEPPDFAGPAHLEAIPTSQAIVELMRRFQGGYNPVILQELGGSSSRLFMELAAIIGQAECYQLFVGPLNEMADLVCNLVGRRGCR